MGKMGSWDWGNGTTNTSNLTTRRWMGRCLVRPLSSHLKTHQHIYTHYLYTHTYLKLSQLTTKPNQYWTNPHFLVFKPHNITTLQNINYSYFSSFQIYKLSWFCLHWLHIDQSNWESSNLFGNPVFEFLLFILLNG